MGLFYGVVVHFIFNVIHQIAPKFLIHTIYKY